MPPKIVKKSVYSKMYLVTQPVYNKLLNCLDDERERQKAQELNAPPEIVEERPAEKAIEEMNIAAMEPQQTTVTEPISETGKIFGTGEGEPIQEEIISEQPPAPIVREEKEIDVDNPLRKSCRKPTAEEEGELISTPTPTVVEKKINKPTLIVPSIKKSNGIKKAKTITSANINPNKSKVFQIPPGKRESEQSNVKPNQCPVCLKFFGRKGTLKKHIETVHKNLVQPGGKEIVETLPDEDIAMAPSRVIKKPKLKPKFIRDEDTPMMEDFPDWTRKTKPVKRTATEAKLRTLKAKSRPSDDYFESWTKKK